MATELDQNFSDLANILMQRRQMQQQQAQQDRANRLADLQYKQLEREDAYQTGLKQAMANPGVITSTTIKPDAPRLSLASLVPGNQLQPQPFEQTPQYGPLASRVQTTVTPRSAAAAGAEYALGQGRFEDAVKLFSVDDHVAQLKAKGDLPSYYQAQRELEEGNKFFDVISKYKTNPEQLKMLWPQVQRLFPQQSAGINPEDVRFNGNSVLLPLEMNGQIVPNKGVFRDEMGKTSIVDLTPKEQPETWSEPYQTKVGGKLAMVQKSSRGQVKPVVQDTSTTVKVTTGNNGGKPAKPLPVSALKMQQEGVDAIGTASGIRADLGELRMQVETGALDLGPMKNLWNKGLNWAGWSSPQSRNLQSFTATLQKLRNDSLRLNKGVQTDGDAQRAWAELIDNINDPKAVSQRLQEIDAINERAVLLHQANIDNIRNNYGLDPLDTSTQRNVQPAIGRGAKGKNNAPKVTKGGFKVTVVK